MRRRGRVFVFFFLLLFGTLGILRAVDNPRLQQAHGSDIVKLVGAGMCFGAAFGILFARHNFPGEGD